MDMHPLHTDNSNHFWKNLISNTVMYCEFRWLSRGECLLRLFVFRKEVLLFLKDHVRHSELLQSEMEDPTFDQNLVFLTDLTQFLNELNKKLQMKGQYIFDMIGSVDGFVRKMEYLKTAMSKNDLTHFKCCSDIFAGRTTADFSFFVPQIESKINEFQMRFEDFSTIRTLSSLFVRH